MDKQLIFYALLSLGAWLVFRMCRKWDLPFRPFMLLLGLGASEIFTGLGFDTGLRWFHLRQIGFYLVLPILVFEAAIHLPWGALKKEIRPVLLLILPIYLSSILLTIYILNISLQIIVVLGLPAIILTAFIFSATDGRPVIRRTKNIGQERIAVIARGENLTNVAIGVILYTTFISISPTTDQSIFGSGSVLIFIKQLTGGILLGLILGFILIKISLYIQNKISAIFNVFILIYGFFWISDLTGVSGVTALIVSGVTIASSNRNFLSNLQIDRHLEIGSTLAESLIFVLMGMTVRMEMFLENWSLLLVAIFSFIGVRLVVMHLFFRDRFLSYGNAGETALIRKSLILGKSGGGVMLILALSIPLSIENWYAIQVMVYGVILFNYFVQVPLLSKIGRNRS